MSLTSLLLNSFLQFMLAGFASIVAMFMAIGLLNGAKVPAYHEAVLGVVYCLIPLSGIASIGFMIYQYNNSAAAVSYWWLLIPLPSIIIFVVYLVVISIIYKQSIDQLG